MSSDTEKAYKIKKLLIIEPFYGGSHKQMIDVIESGLKHEDYQLITMTAKKWPWRARCSSLYLSQNIPNLQDFRGVFCSSVLNLVELLGLCPEMAKLKKIIYFHENQLNYPVKVIKARDYQYGYNQIVSCLAADIVIFNSNYNMMSFLENIKKFIKIQPDYRPKNISDQIEIKSIVLYFPICFKVIDDLRDLEKPRESCDKKVLHLVWAHRWEFDKNPSLFMDALYYLQKQNVDFQVSILGESFSEVPEEFDIAKNKLANNLKNFGFIKSQEEYYKILLEADITVSTADHEFFGVAMLEGVRCGCIPLAPNKLVYPELYPIDCLYNSREDLFRMLKNWCEHPNVFMEFRSKFDIMECTSKFDARVLLPQFLSVIQPSHSQ